MQEFITFPFNAFTIIFFSVLLLLLKLVQMMIPQYYQVTNWTEHFNGISLIKSLLRCAVFAVLQEQTHSLKEIRQSYKQLEKEHKIKFFIK